MKKAAVLIVSLAVAAALSGCGKKIPLAGDQKVYAGKWVADDGTFVVIHADGSGDVRLTNTKVTNGRAVIADDTLTIGVGPFKSILKLTEKPHEAGGRWVMDLDGIRYTRQQ